MGSVLRFTASGGVLCRFASDPTQSLGFLAPWFNFGVPSPEQSLGSLHPVVFWRGLSPLLSSCMVFWIQCAFIHGNLFIIIIFLESLSRILACIRLQQRLPPHRWSHTSVYLSQRHSDTVTPSALRLPQPLNLNKHGIMVGLRDRLWLANKKIYI